MYSYFLFSDYRVCPSCGGSLDSSGAPHRCDPGQKLEWALQLLRHRIDAFETDLAHWLRTPAGRFEVWYAERDRLSAHAA
jgi:hypothetical protein